MLPTIRKCGSPEGVRKAFEYAFAHIKPTDAVIVGMCQEKANQVGMNAGIVRGLLG